MFPYSVQAKADEGRILNVVATLPDYACIVRAIGGNRVSVSSIVSANQDAHFIRPKPSFIRKVKHAELLVTTGLDLELWLPSIVNRSGNRNIASGNDGYVAAAQGVFMLDVPEVVSRSEGGLHLYGNPHITSSPLNMRVVAKNICTGLIKNLPMYADEFTQAKIDYIRKLDEMLYGSDLVKMLGGDLLSDLAVKGRLIPFLKEKSFKGKPLLNFLGGQLKKALPLRNLPIVTYHENWVYFSKLLGLNVVATLEPKPGIPPSARHKLKILRIIKENNVKVIFSANYFNSRLIDSVAGQTGAKAVVVPVYAGGSSETQTYCNLFSYWVNSLVVAFEKKGM